MKKACSLILCLILVLSMAVPAMAADETDATTTYTVTITGHAPNHTYEAYQIFSGNLDTTTGTILSNIQWGAGIKGTDFLAFLTSADTTDAKIFSETRVVDGVTTTVDNVFANCASAEDVAKVLTGYADKDTMLDTFAKYAGNYLLDEQGTATNTTGTTYTISNLPAGYYLIKDKDNSLANTSDDFYTKFMLEVVGNVPVSVKGSVPSIEKTVSDTADTNYGETTSAMIGETVYFELSASLPSNFAIYDDYYMTFMDTMSKGLTFNKIEKVYIQRANEQTVISDSFIDYDATTADAVESAVVVTKNSDGSSSFQIKIGDMKDKDFHTLLLENKIVIRYSATVNEDAVIAGTGNPNEVTLKYSNNPYGDGEGTTGPDEVKVYTFGLKIDKYDKADVNVKLAGAEFVLYRREVYTDAEGKDMLKLNFVVVEKISDGVYKATDWLPIEGVEIAATTALTWENVKTQLSAEQLSSITLATGTEDSTKGQIQITGLDIHTYTLLETKAPDGYNLPRDPFTVTMTEGTDTAGNITMSYRFGSGEAVNAADGYAQASIANGKGNTLPSTGGMGTTLFYLVGGLMVVCAAVLLVTKKRMSVN